MNGWKSFVISAGGHTAILVLSVIIGLFAHQRSLKQEPIRVDLLQPGPIGDNSDKKGATSVEKKEEPKVKENEKPKEIKKEKKKEIITIPKEVQKPTTDLNADLKKLEDFLKTHKLQEVKKTPEIIPSGSGTGSGKSGVYGSGSAYEITLQQIIRNHWMQPGRAVVGPNPPIVLVKIIVDRNGNIISRRITKSSGISQLDESALRAVDDSNPLPKLPSYITGTQKDFELRFIVED